MNSPVWRGRDAELRPFGNIKASDSANLDMVAEVCKLQGKYQDVTSEWMPQSWFHLFTL